jgi:TRAP-type transport system periplasmic protein
MSSTAKITRRTVIAAGAATLSAAHVIPARAAAELRLTHPADTSHPVHIEAEKMAARVAQRTNGAVKITLFPNNALGSPVETAQQTRLGAIDMILMNPANIESISKAVGVINIPYQFDGYEHAHRTLDVTARDWLSQQLATAGFAWIANFEWGFRALSNSRRPINTPADVQGLKLRVPPELAIKAAFEALGANTQTIAFQEVYLALANKAVDGQDNPIGTTFAAKFFEVQSHIALTKHIYASIMLPRTRAPGTASSTPRSARSSPRRRPSPVPPRARACATARRTTSRRCRRPASRSPVPTWRRSATRWAPPTTCCARAWATTPGTPGPSW